jgi:hypothetical protein
MTQRRFHRSLLTVASISALLLMPVAANAGMGDIISLLTTITGTLKNGVGQLLNGIRAINAGMADLQNRVVWPVNVISATRTSVTQIRAQVSSLAEQVHSIPTNSATLHASAQFESLLRGGQTANFSQIQVSYAQLYLTLPKPDQATAIQRSLGDMNDAIALGALKTATASDQASEHLLAIGDSLEQAAASAAPGSAPILIAQAQVSDLESQAMLHRILAVQLRQEAAKLAYRNALTKQSAEANKNLRNNLQQIFNRTMR